MHNYSTWAASLGLLDVALATVLVACVAAALVVSARRGAGRPQLLCAGLLGGYLVLFSVIVLCPLPVGGAIPGADPYVPAVNTEVDLRGVLHFWSISNQSLMNVLLTVPFGLTLPLVVRWGAGRLVLACAALPLAAESLQLLISQIASRPYRSFDVNDLVTNLAGALIGLALFSIVRWVAWSTLPGLSQDPRRHLGAYLALAARRFQPAAVGPELATRRRRSGGVALAATFGIAAAVVLARSAEPLGPAYPADACSSTPPAPRSVKLPGGFTAFGDRGALCLISAHGSSVLDPGDSSALDATESDEQGKVTVLGHAPDQAVRVVLTLPDGRSTRTSLTRLSDLPGWSVYAATLPRSTATGNGEVPEIRVELFDAAGGRL